MFSGTNDPLLSVQDIAREWGIGASTVATLVGDGRIASLDGGRLVRSGRLDVPCVRRSWAERVCVSSAGAARRIDDPDAAFYHPAAAVAYDFHVALQDEDITQVHALSSSEAREAVESPRELLDEWLRALGPALGPGIAMTSGVYRLDPYPGVGVRLIYEASPLPLRMQRVTPVFLAGVVPLVLEHDEWRANLDVARLSVDWSVLLSAAPPS
jgi:hypothetical protein